MDRLGTPMLSVQDPVVPAIYSDLTGEAVEWDAALGSALVSGWA